jgi:hypothetical protein
MKFYCSFLLVLMLIFSASTAFAGDIKIMFPSKSEDKQKKDASGAWYRNDTDQDSEKYIETDLTEFVDKFKKDGYHVDQIELWIEGKAESGAITRFFVSIEGGGGCKIILKP